MDTKTVSIKGQEIIAAVLYQNGPEHWTVYCAIRPQVRTDDMAGKPIFYFFVEAPGYDAPACVGYGPFSACNRILAQLEDYLLGIRASELNKVRNRFPGQPCRNPPKLF